MRITICDDNPEELSITEGLLLEYRDKIAMPGLKIEKCGDPAKLEEGIRANDISDIYVLDVSLGEKSGMEIASLLMEKQDRGIVIFSTFSKEHALEAYHVHAVRYLVKPYKKETFFEAVGYAVALCESKRDKDFLVKTKNGVVTVSYNRIQYVESESRSMKFHLTDGTVIKSIMLRTSFENEIEALLKDEHFIQIHKSFVVNMSHIDRMPQEKVEIGTELLPISKKKAADVKRAYLLYVTNQYR